MKQPVSDELNLLKQGTPRDLRTLQVKLTYVGPQTKPRPTVVFTTFHHLMQMAWFLPMRRDDLPYGNDDVAVWNFTVTPEELKHIVEALLKIATTGRSAEDTPPFLSLMLCLRESRLGDVAGELVLGEGAAESMILALYQALDETNGVGRAVVTLQRQVLFPDQAAVTS
jgi:hypothetical protein